MELVHHFSQETYQRALEDWAWLEPGPQLTPRFTNAFGDVFLEDDRGALWFLDLLAGTVTSPWSDSSALQTYLETLDAGDRFFMAGLAQHANSRGLVPGSSEVLSFTIPPVLGGPISLDNLEVADFEVTVSIAGQIHGQVRDLPPGTKIAGVSQANGDSANPVTSSRRKIWRRKS